MSVDYAPSLVAILFGIAFSLFFLGLAVFLGPKRSDPEKMAPFECGSEPIGSPRVRFSVKFYQVAILFLIFDIESAFLYPWAALYRKLSCLGVVAGTQCLGTVTWFGFVEMLVFVGTLVVALAYVWRKRAIGWG
jgi:NADH-quinone oxidoreductase subunit A